MKFRIAIADLVTTFAIGISLVSCTQKTAEPVPGPNGSVSIDASVAAAELIKRGRHSYMVNCTACHNQDPKKDGSIGPPVNGSSLELLRARVIEGGYPPGYTPKRTTKAMAALPHLKGEIEALHAYLNSPQ